jgi:EAL domain-containing protein (putative c-di-GMP-specific phosphodiesterase class I)
VRIAVDDAGAGFASLRHILLLRPDFIKLDVALCRDVAIDPARAAMARALVAFGADTGSAVVAEGIERQHDQDELQRIGVRLGQGYHLGRPAPLSATRV